MRVKAVDLIDNVHSRDDGVIGGGEQLPRRLKVAPLGCSERQGVKHDDLDLVIADEASLVDDGFEFGVVAVRSGGKQCSGQERAVPAVSDVIPVVGLVEESLREAPGVTDGREQADSLVCRGRGGHDLAEHHRPGRAKQQARGAFQRTSPPRSITTPDITGLGVS